MMDFEQLIEASCVYGNTRVCRLCLNLIASDFCETLEDMQKGMLAVIIPEFNLDLACTPNVICKKCSKLLHESYKFKSACMESSWGQQASNKCCLCLSEIAENCDKSNGVLVNMKLEKCLPELEVSSISKVCDICQPLLDALFTFVTGCLYAETKVAGYVSLNNHDKNKAVSLYEIYQHYVASEKNLEPICKDDRGHCSIEKPAGSEGKRNELNFHQIYERCLSERVPKGSVRGPGIYKYGNAQVILDDSNDRGIDFVKSEVEFGSELKYFEGDGQSDRENPLQPEINANITTDNLPDQTCEPKVSPVLDNSNSEHSKTNLACTYDCKRCDFKTRHKLTLNRHLSLHKNITGIQMIFACELCTFTTRSRVTLAKHMATHAGPFQVEPNKEEERPLVSVDLSLYVCRACPFTTKFKENLKWHMLTHRYASKVKPLLTCDKCNFQTNYERSLKTHLHRYHNDVLK